MEKEKLPKTKKEAHYADNERLLKEYKEWREIWEKKNGKDLNDIPPPTKYMSEVFLELPRRFARVPKYSGYTYKEDLMSCATLAMCRYFWKFDPEISEHPFSFLTQICYFSFIAEIAKERKESYIKYVQTNEFLARGGDLFEGEDKEVKEKVDAILAKHYNESLVAHHDGTVAKIKKHNKTIENSIENLICSDFDAEKLKKDY